MPHSCKGLCETHYRKSRRSRRLTTEERYEVKVDRSAGPDACHPWIAGTNVFGYGIFGHDGETLAGRWAYKHYLGPLASNEVVRHSCDNPPCQNRSHWVKGTQVQNIYDAVDRGRQYRPVGTKNVKAKLTEADVREIRASIAVDPDIFAGRFGVHRRTVLAVKRGQTWKHLL